MSCLSIGISSAHLGGDYGISLDPDHRLGRRGDCEAVDARKRSGGFIITMLLGVAGALLAGFIGKALGWYSDPGQGPGIIASIIGAMLLLLLYRLFVGRRTTVP